MWDILPQNFKSYQEMLRCMLRELCEPTVYHETSNDRLVFSIGDHPKVLLQFNLRMQGDTVGSKGDQRRAWCHLGDVLKAATEACAGGNAPEASGMQCLMSVPCEQYSRRSRCSWPRTPARCVEASMPTMFGCRGSRSVSEISCSSRWNCCCSCTLWSWFILIITWDHRGTSLRLRKKTQRERLHLPKI